MQKIFRKNTIMVMTFSVMVMFLISCVTNMYYVVKQRNNMSIVKIDQIISMMQNNKTELDSIKKNLDEDYLTRARAAAYVIEMNPEKCSNVEDLQELVKLLNVDEINAIDAKGIIRSSSVEKYVGIDFHDGNQTREFLQLLDGKLEYFIQEAQPNTAESKMMKYVGVAVGSGASRGIVQIGLEPVRQMEAQERYTYQYIYSHFIKNYGEDYFAVDINENKVIAHTNDNYYEQDYDISNLKKGTGFLRKLDGKYKYVMTKRAGDTLIGVSMDLSNMLESYWKNIILTLVYMLFIELIAIALLNYLVEKKVIKGIHGILRDVRRITDGNLSTNVNVGGNPEFEELSEGINKMVRSIVNASDRLAKIIDINDMPLVAFEYNDDMQHVFVTNGLKKMLCLGDDDIELLYKDKNLFYGMIKRIMSEPIPGENDVYQVAENKYVHIRLVDEKNGYVGIITDVTEDTKRKLEMKYVNEHDQLTGLYRYKYFKNQGSRLLKSVKDDNLCVVVMMDLDDFKSVNDTYGHDAGDNYLKAFAAVLNKVSKYRCISARRSGDEFCIMMYGCENRDEIGDRLERLWKMFEEVKVDVVSEVIGIKGVSGGVVVLNDSEESMDNVLAQADEALYNAKERGKGVYSEYGSM